MNSFGFFVLLLSVQLLAEAKDGKEKPTKIQCFSDQMDQQVTCTDSSCQKRVLSDGTIQRGCLQDINDLTGQYNLKTHDDQCVHYQELGTTLCSCNKNLCNAAPRSSTVGFPLLLAVGLAAFALRMFA
ncbi:hypothetical protein M3Y99_01331800 [Aphelenchoides fujianensis]|nr:hypothetical protein M3Y99_01331800 [Aphelenchoides fujianensis]